jgi:hypothetical protein
MLIYYDAVDTPTGHTAHLLHNYLDSSQGTAYNDFFSLITSPPDEWKRVINYGTRCSAVVPSYY